MSVAGPSDANKGVFKLSRTYKRTSRAASSGCKNHGCCWCRGNRTIQAQRNQAKMLISKDELITPELEGPDSEQGAYSPVSIDIDDSLMYLNDSLKLT